MTNDGKTFVRRLPDRHPGHRVPGKSVCHGSLGFSTIVLIRIAERVALLDVGSFDSVICCRTSCNCTGLVRTT